jgi:cation diffusion facilitator family transporter
MEQADQTDPRSARYREIRKVTLIGSVIDLLLGVGKIVVGLLAGSHALIADGVHSLSDLATDFLVLFAAKHSHREADAEHPYGHGRIETLATVALGLALVVVAVGISIDGYQRMARDIVIQHGMVALLTALLSVLSKEWIYQYTVRIGRRLRSNMVIANAWHSRTDAISSVIVIVGVGGAMAGYSYLDGVAAIAVALMIAKIGWDLLWKSLQELIDTALEPEMVEEIRRAILAVDGVRACHMLRTRYSGSDSLVDVHILVDPSLSVSEGHQIGERVRKELIEQVEHVSDVTVHIDPEDDEAASPNDQLPMREEIEARLRREWQQDGLDGDVERVVLHYLDGKVNVEVFLYAQLQGDPSARAAAIRQAAGRARDIGEVQVYASAINAP